MNPYQFRGYQSIHRSKLGDDKQRQWFVFDRRVALPEYLVEYEYISAHDVATGRAASEDVSPQIRVVRALPSTTASVCAWPVPIEVVCLWCEGVHAICLATYASCTLCHIYIDIYISYLVI